MANPRTWISTANAQVGQLLLPASVLIHSNGHGNRPDSCCRSNPNLCSGAAQYPRLQALRVPVVGDLARRAGLAAGRPFHPSPPRYEHIAPHYRNEQSALIPSVSAHTSWRMESTYAATPAARRRRRLARRHAASGQTTTTARRRHALTDRDGRRAGAEVALVARTWYLKARPAAARPRPRRRSGYTWSRCRRRACSAARISAGRRSRCPRWTAR